MRPTSISETTIRKDYTVLTRDLNGYGFMHGGRLLMLADEAGFLAAHGFCKTDCLTIAVHQTRFYRSTYKGNHLVLQAQVVLTGKTSLWVPVSISTGDDRLIMRSTVVYVAVDTHGMPTGIRAVTANTDAEKQLQVDIIHLRSFIRSCREGGIRSY